MIRKMEAKQSSLTLHALTWLGWIVGVPPYANNIGSYCMLGILLIIWYSIQILILGAGTRTLIHAYRTHKPIFCTAQRLPDLSATSLPVYLQNHMPRERTIKLSIEFYNFCKFIVTSWVLRKKKHARTLTSSTYSQYLVTANKYNYLSELQYAAICTPRNCCVSFKRSNHFNP